MPQQSALDQAITTAAAGEATYNSSFQNVANIQIAIDTATTPLAPAKAQLVTDATSYNASLDALSVAAIAAKVPTS